jgi:hypothetical protein
VIFSLERKLRGGTKLALKLANKLAKPVPHILDKMEILNVAGPGNREAGD